MDCNFSDAKILEKINEVLQLIRHKGLDYGWNKVNKKSKNKSEKISTKKKNNKSEKDNKEIKSTYINHLTNFDEYYDKGRSNDKRRNEHNNKYYDYNKYYTFNNSYSSYNYNGFNNKNKRYNIKQQHLVTKEVEIMDNSNNVFINCNNTRKRRNNKIEKMAAIIRIIEIKDGKEILLEDNIKSNNIEKIISKNDVQDMETKFQDDSSVALTKNINPNDKEEHRETFISASNVDKYTENIELQNGVNDKDSKFNDDIYTNLDSNNKESTTSRLIISSLIANKVNVSNINFNGINQGEKIHLFIENPNPMQSNENKEPEKISEININKVNLEKLRSYFDKLKRFSFFNQNENTKEEKNLSNLHNNHNFTNLKISDMGTIVSEIEILNSINQKLNKSLQKSESNNHNNGNNVNTSDNITTVNYQEKLMNKFGNPEFANDPKNFEIENLNEKMHQISFHITNDNKQLTKNSNAHYLECINNFQISLPASYGRNLISSNIDVNNSNQHNNNTVLTGIIDSTENNTSKEQNHFPLTKENSSSENIDHSSNTINFPSNNNINNNSNNFFSNINNNPYKNFYNKNNWPNFDIYQMQNYGFPKSVSTQTQNGSLDNKISSRENFQDKTFIDSENNKNPINSAFSYYASLKENNNQPKNLNSNIPLDNFSQQYYGYIPTLGSKTASPQDTNSSLNSNIYFNEMNNYMKNPKYYQQQQQQQLYGNFCQYDSPYNYYYSHCKIKFNLFNLNHI